jgi:glycerophosphoryl diester phosphodiesterase
VILLDPAARPVVAHRGDSAHAPENTMPAFERAVRLGADGLEFDVRLTADGVPVVHHDAALDRTTGGAGLVAARTLAGVRALDAGAHFSPDGGRSFPFRGIGVVVPTLDEVLGAWPAMPVLIEIKEPVASAVVRATLDRHAAAGRAVVASFVDAAVAPFRNSPYATGAARADVARLLAATLAGVRVRPSYQIASVPRSYNGLPLPVGRFARALRPCGVPVHVWTVDGRAEALALWAAGVSGMVSNDPAALLAARAERSLGGAFS